MKKTLSAAALALILFSGLSTLGYSQTAQDVLDKMIAASGGRAVLEAIKDTTMTGTVEMVQFGMSGTITMYQKEPNKMRMDFELMGMTITQAFDGEQAWWVNPQTATQEVMPEQQAQDIRRQSFGNDATLNPSKYGISYVLKDKEKLNDKEYIVLEQVFKDGFKATLYVDPDTYLLYKTKARTVGQMGVEVDAETIYADYQKEGEMLVPKAMTVYQDGQEFIRLTFSKVTFNSNLEDSFFKMTK